ncbi:MAG: phenylalanine--tRNA ligase subunit alpha [Candidatus Paceibacterota bacterium]|jgi:phenylalanyl-tRNA synthetase alpha chain
MDNNIIEKLSQELGTINSSKDLQELWRKYLGKEGEVKMLLKSIAAMSEAERTTQSPIIQAAHKKAIELFEQKEKALSQTEGNQKLLDQSEKLKYQKAKIGHLHPMTQTIRMLNQAFLEMGYSIMDGPEIETEKYCFQRLNVPRDHPARDMQDTIYIKEPDILLRTQTSSIEAHVLETYKPPFKVVCPGTSYRNEKLNKSNHFILHQYQGIVVMEQASLKDLFGTIEYLFKKMYGPEVKIRFRNKYYPEVEPGVGPDMQCFNCGGKGCAICKGVGWIEMGGAGIIHPNVMKMAGLDTKKWKGFAFGLGLDRWVMAKYKITDIRTLLGGNLGYKYYENESTL